MEAGASGPAGLAVCVVARRAPDPSAGHLVSLRQMLTGSVLLGCLADAADVVHEWLEIWIERVDELKDSPEGVRRALTNGMVDEAWRDAFRAWGDLDPRAVLRVGWEEQAPPPLFLDPAAMRVVRGRDAAGRVLRLCRDDALLAARGLPTFTGTLHRYLHAPEGGPDAPLVPVTRDAPRGAATAEPAEPALVPLNAACGLMQVHRHRPVAYEAFVDVLAGGPWQGLFHGPAPLPLAEPLRELSQSSTAERLAGGHLLLARHGQAGRMIEVLHLKLAALAGAVSAVRRFAARAQRPLLCLNAASFRVELPQPGPGLPYLWTASVHLVDPGDAVGLAVPGSDVRYFLRGRGEHASIYRPASGRPAARGTASVRLRRILESKGSCVIEGTLHTAERLELATRDLLWMRVPVAGSALHLYAHADAEGGMATGEVRFRSVPQQFGAERAAALRPLEGVPIESVPFEVVPLLSAPCDLYALGVLAVRTLLVGPGTTLPVALDETLSLARSVAAHHDDAVGLPLRLRGIIEEDPRWMKRLGPQALVQDPLEPAEALGLVPADLWSAVLSMIVRLFPGIGPDSICRDLGDAPAGGMHKVFDPALEDLQRLLLRARSLIVVDWTANREMHGVIRKFAAGVRAGGR
jgi:hypothetical protein